MFSGLSPIVTEMNRRGHHRFQVPAELSRLPYRQLARLLLLRGSVRSFQSAFPGTSRPRDRHSALSGQGHCWRMLRMVGSPLIAAR
jgi:hypothetical protein